MKFSPPRNKLTRTALGWSSVLLCFLLIKLTSKGEKNIPKKGPYILAPNHFSLLDPFILQAKHKKPTTFLMAEDLDDLGWRELWIPWLYGVLLVHRKNLKPSTIRAVEGQQKVTKDSSAWQAYEAELIELRKILGEIRNVNATRTV